MVWGACVGDLCWSPFGSYFELKQINLLKQYVNSGVRIMLEKGAWDTDDRSNILGIPYKDYVKQLVDWCHASPRFMSVVLDLARDLSFGSGTFTVDDKIDVIKNHPTYWRDWGTAIINYLGNSFTDRDALYLMDEPAITKYVDKSDPEYVGDDRAVTQEQYRNFCNVCIEGWRNVKPYIPIFVMAVPYRELYMFIEGKVGYNGYVGHPLNYSGIYYALNYPYYEGDPSCAGLPSGHWSDLYCRGLIEEAKANLYSLMNSKIGNLTNIAWTVAVRDSYMPNWKQLMLDTYDYVYSRGFHLFQFGAQKNEPWNIFNKADNYQSFSEIGQFWAENSPALPPLPPTPISPIKRAVPILAPFTIGTVLYLLSQRR